MRKPYLSAMMALGVLGFASSFVGQWRHNVFGSIFVALALLNMLPMAILRMAKKIVR